MTFQVSTLGIFSHFEKSLGGPERTQVRVPIRKKINNFSEKFTILGKIKQHIVENQVLILMKFQQYDKKNRI